MQVNGRREMKVCLDRPSSAVHRPFFFFVFPRMRRLPYSKSSLKRSSRSSPIPKTNSRSRLSSAPSNAGMGKKVKFSGSTNICEPEAMRDGPLPHNEGDHISCFDGAKTSEFKSFKKLLEKTAHKHYFDKAAEADIKLKEGKARDCMEASSNAISRKSDIRRSPLPVQNVSFIVQGCFSSPVPVSQKHAKRNNGAVRSVALLATTKMERLFHPSPQIVGKIHGGGHSGPMQEPKGTFSEKRSCLLLLAAGTRSQNVDDFLSNRSDFILEILLRLGIRNNINKHEKFRNPQQNMSAHQFLASSKRSNQIVKFCDNSQENSCTNKTEQYENLLAVKWDNTEIQAFPCNHSLKTSFKCKHWNSNFLAEKAATLLPHFENPASAIELIKEFDCNKYSHTDRALTLPNSPCGLSEVNVFPTDCAAYMEPLYKNPHINSALDHKGLFDFCVKKDSNTSIISKLEVDCSTHGPHRRNYDSFQADCIFSNSYNSKSFFQEQPFTPFIHPEIAKEQFTFPLLEWDGTAERELPALKCLVPKEVDHFTKSLNDTFDFHNQMGSSSFLDAYRRKSFNFLTELQF